MSGQWNPYAKETDIESEPREASQVEDEETEERREHRFRRRTD
jgi:hypothetical protein